MQRSSRNGQPSRDFTMGRAQIHHTRYSRLFHEAMIGLPKEIHPEIGTITVRVVDDTKNGLRLAW